jgi:hypothetical protein
VVGIIIKFEYVGNSGQKGMIDGSTVEIWVLFEV